MFKKLFFALALGALAIPAVKAQAACSVSAPCLQITWTNTAMTATVVTNSSGIETSGPGSANVYICANNSTTCGTPATNPTLWTKATVTQTTSAGSYTFTSAAYGVTYTAIETDTWSGALGGIESAYSSPFQFSTPAAPASAPAAPTTPTITLKTS